MPHLEADDRGVVVPCPSCGQLNRLAYERLSDTAYCTRCKTTLRPPGEPVEVKSEAAYDALTGRSTLPVLVDYWAEWCGPCKMVEPQLAKVASEGAGRWLIARVDTEAFPSIAARLRIQAIPMLIVFRQGRIAAQQAGAMMAPAIRQFIEQAR